MGGMRQLSVCVLVSALACCVAAPPAVAKKDAGPGLDALVLGRADSPALEAIDDMAKLRLRAAGREADPRPGPFDLVIFDGDSLTAPEIADAPAIDDFVASGKWVLALDVSAKDHVPLTRLTGLNLAGGGGPDRSEMMLLRIADVEGTPEVDVVDSGRLPNEEDAPGGQPLAELRRDAVDHMAQVALERIRAADPRESGKRRAGVDQKKLPCPQLDPAPSDEVQHVGWCWTEIGTAGSPYGYWTKPGPRGCGCKKPWWMDEFSDNGSQTVRWVINHRLDAFLNSDTSHPKGTFQTILYDVNGQVTPKDASERFFRMDDTFTSGYFNFGSPQILERAWWTGAVGVAVTPNAETDGKLVWEAANPQTPNAETSYSSGEEFSIGFAGSGAAGNLQNVANLGLGVNLGYSTSKSKTHTISDWGVENLTSGNRLRWQFSARHPCDVRADASHIPACFEEGKFDPYRPLKPNALSRGNFTFHASGRWRTKQLLTKDNGKLTFDVSTPLTLVDTYCEQSFPGWCGVDGVGRCTYCHYRTEGGIGPPKESVDIQADWVDPIPIKELKLAPSANGAKDDTVTGTVELERAANVPVHVTILSDSPNAKVGPPIAGIPQASYNSQKVIGAGEKSVDFEVETNDNGLAAGGHTTAKIFAFYGGWTSKSLRVESK